ncbi:MAG TPA: hypothetical protein VFI30_06150 [Nocardioidaceae bacterium]|nr:hypothetical protein [Nocardioidaceae bacterium]
MTQIFLAQPEHMRHLPASPWVFGGIAFVIFLALMLWVLSFGKGRPHA